ncbi:UDP-GalNAc:beta-1,3-N-acetylgalactosaminyltransferase 1 isoform X2 [Gallus gallus]|uniref:UDP-GalNAc:beta-1, 3-N-acetylgalactosaminyltransferase 1 isoform X2 n=1 Tax=Gallus gallus TaxID=9031 RepID=UPI001AE5BA60|nr:UDP-GalNAc:beta-1,3-N-acetylgalactosaminyltransferase 1 isoform X2 [Gallus gallus]
MWQTLWRRGDSSRNTEEISKFCSFSVTQLIRSQKISRNSSGQLCLFYHSTHTSELNKPKYGASKKVKCSGISEASGGRTANAHRPLES